MLIIAIVLLIVFGSGAAPTWGYWGPNGSRYGWWPSGVITIIVALLLIRMLLYPAVIVAP